MVKCGKNNYFRKWHFSIFYFYYFRLFALWEFETRKKFSSVHYRTLTMGCISKTLMLTSSLKRKYVQQTKGKVLFL